MLSDAHETYTHMTLTPTHTDVIETYATRTYRRAQTALGYCAGGKALDTSLLEFGWKG